MRSSPSVNSRGFSPRTLPRKVITLLFIAVMGVLATIPLDWEAQAVVGGLLFLLGWSMDRSSPGKRTTLCLMMLATFVTTRYAYWRIWQTVTYVRSGQPYQKIDLVFVSLLLLAEVYAFLELYLGFFQTVQPLHRAPVPLPADPSQWPAVDAYIPTYNEDLDLVRYTVIAALNMDWPADKLRVYLLDDGNREEFRRFAEEIGCEYISRPVHNHAKAGNINHALGRTKGDFIAIFDSDHIPTRSFLQITMGWFLKDHRLGLLQTPHHFYSPDPFERNLSQFRRIPNEGELFYGLVQDGNDLWNATFFCGSCAVIRRTALEEIGGIAVETVTEDAHTSLRLQRRGWNTAYINIPQAAGLATESLSGHIGQRIRWARGMIQILRTDNPLFGPGLKLPQRLCYFNAMLHFLYAVPRLIFLTSPLVYLLLGHSNFFGYWVTIFAYALPHILLSNLTNSRIQGRYRFSFWNEIYEAVLAPYILLPTLVALVAPSKGKFNVTAKGGLVEKAYFDRRMAWPYLALLGLNLLGLAVAIPRFMIWNVDHRGAVLLNVIWTFYNVMILSVATAVASETQQRRADVRVDMETPFALLLDNNQIVRGTTVDLSNRGVQVDLDEPCAVRIGEHVHFVLASANTEATFSGTIVGNQGHILRLRFSTLNLQGEEALTRLLYSRADRWIGWRDQRDSDRPLRSLLLIFRISLRGFGLAVRGAFSRAPVATSSAAEDHEREVKLRAAAVAGVERVLMLMLGLLLCGASMRAQTRSAKSAQRESGTAAESSQFSDHYTFQALGQKKTAMLRGPDGEFHLAFGIPISKVVSSATLLLRYSPAPELLTKESQIQLRLNGNDIDLIPVEAPGENGVSEARVVLPSDLLTSDNELIFELRGKLKASSDAGGTNVLTRIDLNSEIELDGSILPLANDLGLLPAPFFDRSNNRPLDLPFVFATSPSFSTLQAAGIVASYFGVLTDHRGAHFPVRIRDLPTGNFVYFVDRSAGGADLDISGAQGPSIAIRSNPKDNYSKVLLIIGDSAQQLVTAARALALQQFVRSGSMSSITSVDLPAPMQPDTAPRWLRTDRLTTLADYAAADQLQVYGTGSVDIYFRVPPDLYFGDRETIPLHLKYRYGGVTSGTSGTLTLKMNGAFVGTVPLQPGAHSSATIQSATLAVSRASLSHFGNTLTAEFSFSSSNQGAHTAATENLFGAIQKDSTLDLRGIAHFVEMPNLGLFSDAGFPFTRVPDLSRTAVILPSASAPEEISLYLAAVAAFGARTGYPATRVEVGPAENVNSFRGRHLLVIGSATDQPLLPRWAARMPVSFSGDRYELSPANWWMDTARRWIGGDLQNDGQRLADVIDSGPPPEGVAMEFESPQERGSTVVVLAAPDPKKAEGLSDLVMASASEGTVSGNVSFLTADRIDSFTWNKKSYYLGELGWYRLLAFWVTQYFLLLPFTVVLFAVVLARWLNRWLQKKSAARLALQDS